VDENSCSAGATSWLINSAPGDVCASAIGDVSTMRAAERIATRGKDATLFVMLTSTD
jgi:hypothetical protein